jgi:hypothetical protein
MRPSHPVLHLMRSRSLGYVQRLAGLRWVGLSGNSNGFYAQLAQFGFDARLAVATIGGHLTTHVRM